MSHIPFTNPDPTSFLYAGGRDPGEWWPCGSQILEALAYLLLFMGGLCIIYVNVTLVTLFQGPRSNFWIEGAEGA